MNNFLFLKFENAGYFPDSSKSKDFVFELNSVKKRSDFKQYLEPINVNHISNMLHVLMGERPKPSLRKTIFERDENIFNIAGESYIKITTPTFENKYNNRHEYPKESITIRKAVFNSYSKIEIISWEKIRQLLENDLFFEFMAILNIIFGESVIDKYTSDEAVDIINEKYLNNELLVDFMENKLKGKMPLIRYINKDKNWYFNSNARTISTVVSGVDKIVRLSGVIIVPLDDFYLNKLNNGRGVSRLLDGGLVYIDKVLRSDEIYDSDLIGYTKVSNISTEIKNLNQ
jgi:hypothetical protein